MVIQRILRLAGFYRIPQRILTLQVVSAASKFHKRWRQKCLLSAPALSLALFGSSKSNDSKESITTKKVLLAKADALFESGEYQKIYDLLIKYRDNKDVEILWRLSRALFNHSKSASDVEAKRMVYEGYDIMEDALKIDNNHWAVHKWMAVLSDTKNEYEGIKARIKNLLTCKEHMMKAIELNPNDATTLYMLGNWCFSVADMPWYQRKIASAIFGTVPSSSYEEALQYFETAEKIDPLFYSHNLLFLGKTYLKLQRKDEAMKYLKMTAEFPARNDEDHRAKLEATKILGTL
ncbi:regulator of microtubule dynamics protein 1-like [Fopius arisanus]|uniref:Regulator of microtubule dynamics protein 1 n=1 Tax=Fopius arisanus TaxID=64838 RepID=A0A9R1UA16_9HYME|nr:PREDICTED: regulator of microtubule dynamics protein 1-like [Fopius arisanus]